MEYKRTILNFSFVVPKALAGMARPGMIDSLSEDLAFLRSEGIKAIVSLSELPLDQEVLEKNGFAYIHIPVTDFTAPTMGQVKQGITFMEHMIELEKRPVVVHCGAGCGRTGTLLACYMVKKGETSEEAIRHIRSLRPCSIETDSQRALVYQYEEHLKYQSSPE